MNVIKKIPFYINFHVVNGHRIFTFNRFLHFNMARYGHSTRLSEVYLKISLSDS